MLFARWRQCSAHAWRCSCCSYVRRCWCNRVPALPFNGRLPAASINPGLITRRRTRQRCSLMAGCWSQEVRDHVRRLFHTQDSQARNFTIRPRGIGRSQAASMMVGCSTRRRCSAMAGCWSREVGPTIPTRDHCRARNCTNPATGNWTRTIGMHEGRVGHTATLLFDGRVLVVGSLRGDPNSAELYDPAMAHWSLAAPTLPVSVSTRRPCWLAGRCWWQRDTMGLTTFVPTRKFTIRPRELGRRSVASPLHARTTRRLCWPTVRCWWLEGRISIMEYWQAQNSTTRPPEIGHRPAASMLPAGSIPQHCFAMARCWSQVALTAKALSRAWKFTIRLREIGRSQAASIMLGPSTARRCSLVASCSSQVEIAPAAAFSQVRNSIILVPPQAQAVGED